MKSNNSLIAPITTPPSFSVIRFIHRGLILVSVLLLTACVSLGVIDPASTQAYIAEGTGSRYAPIFIHQNHSRSYNRIGSPIAERSANGKIRVSIDPRRPTIYFEQRSFKSQRGRSYTNLIYRVHFEKVPYRLVPFHVTAGRNPGLLVIVTLDAAEKPVLYTTVHSCGCYKAFVATSEIDVNALPPGWPATQQKVYGETLPSIVRAPSLTIDETRLVVTLRDGSHRVTDLKLSTLASIRSQYQPIVTPLAPMEALTRLPLADGTVTSFYRPAGFRKGYVRSTHKPFELLLISWWSLDPNVGIDKSYGHLNDGGPSFHTSFKRWRRNDSDMRDFARFLDYWGWRL